MSFGYTDSKDPTSSSSFGESFESSFGSKGSQSSTLSDVYPDRVWGVQSPYLADLYSRAQNIYNTGGNQAQAQQMWGQGGDAMARLLNPGANPLMEVYQQQMQQGLEQNILPTIRRESMGHGMIGGGRQGVAEGMAMQQAAREQANFGANLYNQDMNRALGTLQQMPAYMNAGMGIPWFGAQQYAGILGSPTVLDQGSRTVSSSSSYGKSGSSGYGYKDTESSGGGGGGGFSFGL